MIDLSLTAWATIILGVAFLCSIFAYASLRLGGGAEENERRFYEDLERGVETKLFVHRGEDK